MRKIIFFGLSSLILILIACGPSTQKKSLADIPNDWKSIDEPEYTIQYPDSFDLDKSGKMGTTFLLLSRLTSDQDKVRESVTLIIQYLNGLNMSLDKYIEMAEGQMKTLIPNIKIIESKRIKSGNSEYHKFIYTADRGQLKLKFEQYCMIKNEKVYGLSLTCEMNQFDKYKIVGEKIMDSFKLK